jgi:hypothetical protein
VKPSLPLIAALLCLAWCPAAGGSILDALHEPRAAGTVDLQRYIQTQLNGVQPDGVSP